MFNWASENIEIFTVKLSWSKSSRLLQRVFLFILKRKKIERKKFFTKFIAIIQVNAAKSGFYFLMRGLLWTKDQPHVALLTFQK